MKLPDESFRWRPRWHGWISRVYDRLETGEQEYGNQSFRRSPLSLIGEVREENADRMGWGFMLDVALDELETKVRRMLDRVAKLGKCPHCGGDIGDDL